MYLLFQLCLEMTNGLALFPDDILLFMELLSCVLQRGSSRALQSLHDRDIMYYTLTGVTCVTTAS